MTNRWNEEQIKNIQEIIKIDLRDENIQKSLQEWNFASLPGTIRDISFNWETVAEKLIENSDRSDEEKKADKEGIAALFSSIHKGQFNNPDYMDLGEYLTPAEITSLYDSAFAMMLSTNIMSEEAKEKMPGLIDDLSDSYNASVFLKETSLKIADKLGCSDLAHELLYDGKKEGIRPFFPIVGLKNNEDYPSKQNSRGRIYYDARDRMNEYYRKFDKLCPENISPEAKKTIFTYAVLSEVEKIERSEDYNKYKFKNVYKSPVTWGETLDNFKKYTIEEYLPKNCYNMNEKLFSMQKEINIYDKEVHDYYKEKGLRVNMAKNLTKDVGKNATCHIHHIFPQSQYLEFADQPVNYAPLTPTDHLLKAHPDNKTKVFNKEFQQFLLFEKFKECSEGNIKSSKMVYRGEEKYGFLNMLDQIYKTDEISKAYYKNPDMTALEFADLIRNYDKDFVRPISNKFIRKTIIVDVYKDNFLDKDKANTFNQTYDEMLGKIKVDYEKMLSTDTLTKLTEWTDNKNEKQLIVNDIITELRDKTEHPTQKELFDILKANLKDDYRSYKEEGLSDKQIHQKLVNSAELITGIDHGNNRYLAVPISECLRAITKQEESNRYYEYHVETMKIDYDDKLLKVESDLTVDDLLAMKDNRLSEEELNIKKEFADERTRLARICDYGKSPEKMIDEYMDKIYPKFLERYGEKEIENQTIELEEERIMEGDCR